MSAPSTRSTRLSLLSQVPATGAESTESTESLAERLGRIAEILEIAHRDESGPASLVRLGGLMTDSIDLGLLPIASDEVYDQLLGTTIPAEWDAAGFVVHGTARSIANQPGAVLGDATVVTLCARDGSIASVLRVGDGEPTPCGEPDAPGEGRLMDVLRRSLGLATSPPAVESWTVAVDLWLHRVHEHAVDSGSVDTATIDRLRPMVPASWERLRCDCADGLWPELDIEPHLARWMDDGMFSRTCAESFAEPVEILVELSELLAPEVWVHVLTALGALGDEPR